MVKDHIHKLVKHKYPNGTAVFFCVLDCNFKIEVPFALGKQSLCNICSEPFSITKLNLKQNEPHCNNCGRLRVKTEDGKTHYINKRSASSKILQTVAVDTTNDLKARLIGVVKSIDDSEDI